MKAKAIVFPEPNRVDFAEFDLPSPGPGQILTRTLYTGVSTGTELRVLRGGEEGAVFPLVPGYENVGEIVAVGAGVSLAVGTRVFVTSFAETGPFHRVWGAQTAYVLGDASGAFVFPEGVDPIDALYAKTGAIALHGIKRGRVTSADTVAVVGQGLIGLLAAQAAKAMGAKVIAVDILPVRLEAARKAGIDYVIDAGRENTEEAVKHLSGGGVDVAVDATGVAATVDGTIRLLRLKPWQPPYPPSGRAVILGSYTEPVSLHYHPTIFDLEPDIFASRDSTPDDIRETLGLIAEGKIRPRVIQAKVVPYTEAPRAYHDLAQKAVARAVFDWTRA